MLSTTRRRSSARTAEPNGGAAEPRHFAPRSGDDQRASGSGWHRRLLLLLLVLSCVAWMPRLEGPVDLRYDAGVYYILGTSLAEGRGYRLLNEPGAPAEIQYPPALPFLGAAYQTLAGGSNPAVAGHWIRVTNSVLFVAYIIATYLLAAMFLPSGWAFLVALITLLHVQTHWMAELFFAEIPYSLISVAFFLVLRWGRRGGTAAAWVLGSLAFLLRTAGIALLAAWAGESLLRWRVREFAIRAALAFIPILAWQGYIAAVRSDPAYADVAYPYQRASYQFYNVSYLENLSLVDPFVPELGYASATDWALRVARNVASMPESWGEAVSSDANWTVPKVQEALGGVLSVETPRWLVVAPFILLGLAAVAGLVRMAYLGEWMIPLYVAGSTAIVCLTPWPGQFQRYLAPLTPFLALGFVITVALLYERTAVSERPRHALRTALVVAVALFVLGLQVRPLYKVYSRDHAPAFYRDAAGQLRPYRLFFYTAAWREHDAALDWLGRAARPGDVVATSTPHWAYIQNGLQAIMPPFEGDAARSQELVEAVPVEYLVVDSLEFIDITRRYAAPMVQAFPERWRLVHASPGQKTRVYQRVGSAGSTESP